MSIISAGTTSGNALVSTGDTTGQLVLQTNGTTTAVTIGTNQVVTLAQPLPASSGGTGITTTPTAGTVPYGNGSTLAFTAAGTSGQVLTSAGSGAPTWTTPSAGAMVYISQVVASGSSTVDIENSFTAYDSYVIIGSGITVAGSDVYLATKQGGAYVSTSYQYYGNAGYAGGGAPTVRQSTNDASIYFYGNGFNATGPNFNIQITVPNPSQTTQRHLIQIFGSATTNTGAAVLFMNNGSSGSTAAVTGVRLLGATFTGTFRLYGIANS